MMSSQEPDGAAPSEPPRVVLYCVYATLLVVLITVFALVGAYGT